MSQTASDFLVNRLYECGVRHIYGYPGDEVNGVVWALDRAKDKIRFVQARREGAGRVHGLRAGQVHR